MIGIVKGGPRGDLWFFLVLNFLPEATRPVDVNYTSGFFYFAVSAGSRLLIAEYG